jgi:hypothetical protein
MMRVVDVVAVQPGELQNGGKELPVGAQGRHDRRNHRPAWPGDPQQATQSGNGPVEGIGQCPP